MARELAARLTKITKDPDYASQLTSILTEQLLTDDQIKKYYMNLDLAELDKSLDYLKAVTEISKYQGFNPKETIKILIEVHDKHAQEVTLKLFREFKWR